ncbi:hypothetical protein MHO82_09215 [Vibrio sp. Of7-15]|uniref:hypothetical protein n=1 Tax=Vibrio sp. Of7-15 TaxID=2724879 RepID=UPI001EF340E7|nr:hypothetical protein [Vibrio sp. Of7-15]MCG7497044.1 hypothetical protein [Vibrio sp. Of7-15]
MKKIPAILSTLVFFFLGASFSAISAEVDKKVIIFINSDDVQQQEQVNELNTLLMTKNNVKQKIFVIDTAIEGKPFLGEVNYLHDSYGYYTNFFLPQIIPEVIEVIDDFPMDRYHLDRHGFDKVSQLVTGK